MLSKLLDESQERYGGSEPARIEPFSGLGDVETCGNATEKRQMQSKFAGPEEPNLDKRRRLN